MNDRRMLVLVNGMGGAGKSTIGRLLCSEIQRSSWIDIDALAVTNPWEFSSVQIELSLRSAAALIDRHFLSGLSTVILSGGCLNADLTSYLLARCPRGVEVLHVWLAVTADARRERKAVRGRDEADGADSFELVDRKYGALVAPVRIEGVANAEIEGDELGPHTIVSSLLERIRAQRAASSLPLTIAPLVPEMIAEIVESFAMIGWSKSHAQYEGYLAEQAAGSRTVLVALFAERFAGYVTVNWCPSYPPFRDAGIPEIQDLNVLPQFRAKGIGTALLDAAEARIAPRSRKAGIGVGLHPGYNAAQRLYPARGYVPDGHGVTSHMAPVAEGAKVEFDDELVLWMTKHL